MSLFDLKRVDVTNAVSIKEVAPKVAKVSPTQVNILVQAKPTIKFPQSIISKLGLDSGNNFYIASFGASPDNLKGDLYITTIPTIIKEIFPKAKFTGRAVNAEGKITHQLLHDQLGGTHSEWNIAEEPVMGFNPNSLDYETSKHAAPGEVGYDTASEVSHTEWFKLVLVKDGASTRDALTKEATGYNPDEEASADVLAQVADQLDEDEALVAEFEDDEAERQAYIDSLESQFQDSEGVNPFDEN